MTVSSTTTKVSYSGNGSTTVFAYTFKVFDEDDLTVILRTDATGTEAVQTKTTHYTVSGVGNASGGNVTFGTAPASGKTVVIRRSAPLTQTTDYTPNDPFPAEEHENALDKLTFLTQQIQEEADRALKLSRTNTMTSTEFTVGATDRANKILSFDSSGELSVTQELGVFKGDWGASTTYAVRDLVKDTSTNNIFICLTAHTSSGSQPLTTNTDSAKWSLIVDAASATTSASAAATSATAAASSATAAASSASSATSSASSATSSASTASTAATAAQTAQSAAETAETNAETAETNAETAETNAASSATAASNSATAAASSASTASGHATTATTKASEAATSATNAATSASTASTQATNASNSASTATTKASEASTSATNAASSATAAASSATAAAASLDAFDDLYLGAKSSDPTVDNDGDALTAGDLYFNTTSDQLKYYTGSAWVAIAPGIANVSEDTSPQLGGALDVQTHSIVSTSNRDITLAPNGTGEVTLSNNILATAGTTSIRPAGTEIVTINNTGDITVKGQGANRAMMVLQAGSNTSNSQLRFGDQAVDSAGRILYDHSSNFMRFDTNEAEKMRIDSSGNLLVGKTADNVATVGIEARGTGPLISTRDGADALRLNRLNSDGEIIQLRKDGTVVGSIKAGNGDLMLGTGDVNLRFFDATPAVIPRTASDGTSSTVVDLGNVSNSFKDLYCQRVKGAAGHTGEVHFTGSHDVRFVTNGNERARITSGGKFVVGKTSFGNLADAGAEMANSGYGMFSRTTGTVLFLNRNDTGAAVNFYRNQVFVGSISVTSSGTTYNTTSDIRLKQDIEPLQATDKLMAMNPVSYSWKADPDGPRSMGFIAQEMQEVMPEAVSTADDDEAMMSMDYGRITPILVSALQDAHRKIEQLEQRIADMEAK